MTDSVAGIIHFYLQMLKLRCQQQILSLLDTQVTTWLVIIIKTWLCCCPDKKHMALPNAHLPWHLQDTNMQKQVDYCYLRGSFNKVQPSEIHDVFLGVPETSLITCLMS